MLTSPTVIPYWPTRRRIPEPQGSAAFVAAIQAVRLTR